MNRAIVATAMTALAGTWLALGCGDSGSGGGAGGSGSGSGGSGADAQSSSGSGGSSSSSGGGSSSGGSSGGSGGSSGGNTSSSSSGGASSSGSDAGAGMDAGIWGPPMDGGPPIMGTPTQGTVTVTRGTTMGHLAPGFAGLSYEKAHLTDAYFSGSNAALIAMCKLLGPSVLRIGGNAVDATTWQPAATPVAPGTVGPNIGTADVDNLAAFANAIGWKVIYGVNLKTNTPAAAAAEAKYAASKLGGNLYAFEIGNEVEQFKLTYAQVLANWKGEASAMQAAVTGASFVGPDTGGTSSAAYTGWTVPFAKDEAGTIALLTQHYYRGNGAAASSTLAELLAPDPGLTTMLQALQSAVSSNNIRDSFRFSEANSFFNHGAPGVSDTLGSALWAIDFMFRSAQYGANGVNFHGGGPGQDPKHPQGFSYTPIDEANSQVTGAKPIFYGMLLVSLAGTGDLYATAVQANNLNFSAYAVGQSDGSTNIVLDNKDTTNAVQASVDVGAAVTRASAVYLQGPSLTATTGVTLAGAGVTPVGAWSPSAPWALPVAGAIVTVVVPPASAALVHAQ